MALQRFDRVKMNKMLLAGATQAEVAQEMGVSAPAISKASKGIHVPTVRSVALENAHRLVGKTLNAQEQISKINLVTLDILDQVTGDPETIDRMVRAVEKSLDTDRDPKEVRKHISALVGLFTENRTIALKACAEVRNQIALQADLLKSLYDVEGIQAFQTEVLEAIGEVEPEVRKNIVRKLKDRATIRGAIKYA